MRFWLLVIWKTAYERSDAVRISIKFGRKDGSVDPIRFVGPFLGNYH